MVDPTGNDVGFPGVDGATGIPYDQNGNDAPLNTRWKDTQPTTRSNQLPSKKNSYNSLNVTLGRDIIEHAGVGGAAAVTVDNESNMYVSLGATGGIAAPSPISPFSATASKGIIRSEIPSSNFLPGWSLNSGFTTGVFGAGQMQGSSGFATEYIIGIPQTGFNLMYTWKIGRFSPGIFAGPIIFNP